MTTTLPRTATVRGATRPGSDTVLTPGALAFVTALDGAFAGRRAELLQARRERAKRISAGETPDFLGATRSVRADTGWRVSPAPAALQRRRVELVAPPTASAAATAMSSGADVWVADLADGTAPTWANIVNGQLTLHRAIRSHRNGGTPPTISVRPRGWHLCEKHLTIDGRPLPASLVDVGLFVHHNAELLAADGQGPFFHLPKLESHLEARLWNDVFTFAEQAFALPAGTIRATVSIDTVAAAFEMDEILFELREHSAGLAASRTDLVFSAIRTFAQRGPAFDLPDRGEITATTPFLRAYTELLVSTCHRRGALAIGAAPSFTPSRTDELATARAVAGVRMDTLREASDGFDGSAVTHPELVAVVGQIFGQLLEGRPNQVDRQRPDVRVAGADLLAFARTGGQATMTGLRQNVAVALEYLAGWVGGDGTTAPQREWADAATAELCRTQIWQWTRNATKLAEGMTVTTRLVRRVLAEELARLRREAGPDAVDRLTAAEDIVIECALKDYLPGFFTNYGYVKYLLDPPLRMTGRLDHHTDLRMSEQV
jgi:malate synthase